MSTCAPRAMTPRKSILTRLYTVLVLVLVLPVGVLTQMVRIHVEDGAALRDEGLRQASSYVDIPAVRGAIYDRNGRALVVNTARYDVALDPTVPGFSSVWMRTSRRMNSAAGLRASIWRSRGVAALASTSSQEKVA